MFSSFRKKFGHYIALAVLLLPLPLAKNLPSLNGNHNGQKTTKEGAEGESAGTEQPQFRDFKHMFIDQLNRQFADYIVNNTDNQHDIGIHPDGVRNMYLKPGETNPIIESVFLEDGAMRSILALFRPEASDIKEYLGEYQILSGEDIDYYLETVRKGSWGTTVMSVDRTGRVHFDSISLRSFLLAPEYQTNPESLRRLVREEFFQAHQYDAIAGGLYNSGYLPNVSAIKSPEALVRELSVGNLRAFLELFPQQKYLLDQGWGRNSYNYYIGATLYPGPASQAETINPAYQRLSQFISQDLGIAVKPETFLQAEKIKEINEAFRSKYLDYYQARGVEADMVQIWNLVGMKRANLSNPENSLDMPALLELPTASN